MLPIIVSDGSDILPNIWYDIVYDILPDIECIDLVNKGSCLHWTVIWLKSSLEVNIVKAYAERHALAATAINDLIMMIWVHWQLGGVPTADEGLPQRELRFSQVV